MSTSSVVSIASALCGRYRRNVEDLAGGDVDDLRLVLSEEETEDALEDVGQLLVLVRVLRDDTTLLEIDMRQHQPLS